MNSIFHKIWTETLDFAEYDFAIFPQ